MATAQATAFFSHFSAIVNVILIQIVMVIFSAIELLLDNLLIYKPNATACKTHQKKKSLNAAAHHLSSKVHGSFDQPCG